MSHASFAPFPLTRPRRLRQTPWIRDMVREHTVTSSDLIWPIFICEGDNSEQPVPSMPGVSRLSVDLAIRAAEKAAGLGIPCIALFPNTPSHLRTEERRSSIRLGKELVERAFHKRDMSFARFVKIAAPYAVVQIALAAAYVLLVLR